MGWDMGPHGAKDGFSTDAWGRWSQHNQFEGNGNHPSTKSSRYLCLLLCEQHHYKLCSSFLVLEITFTVISIALFTLYLALLSSLLPANANAVQPQIFEQPLSGLSKRDDRKNLNPVTPQDIMSSSPRVGARRRSRLVLGTTPPNSKAFPVPPPTTLYTQLLLPPRPFNEHLLAGCV